MTRYNRLNRAAEKVKFALTHVSNKYHSGPYPLCDHTYKDIDEVCILFTKEIMSILKMYHPAFDEGRFIDACKLEEFKNGTL